MMKKAVVFSILVVISAIFYRGNVKKGEIVQTKAGQVQGIISVSRDGREFYEWLGIPYAKPPIGQKRFASPEAAEEWEGVKETSSYSEKCAQLEMLTNKIIGQEDCLYLNVHTPKVADWEKKKLPVIVYIHGGGYNFMGASDYRPEYFMDEDVVLVVINYRLAMFGFLSTGDDIIRGNMGLRDQILALKWVKENIYSFGGDANRITIAGESAGAASVHMNLITPLTKGLFKKAIAHSGVATCPWGIQTTAQAKAMTAEFAKSANCPFKESSQLLECLRRKSSDQLLEAYVPFMQGLTIFKPYLKGEFIQPCIEGVNDSETVLAEHPLKIVEEGSAQRVPWMLGVVSAEGLLAMPEFYREPESMKLFASNFNDLTLNMFGIPPEMPGAQEIANKIQNLYFPPNETITEEAKQAQYTKMFGDANFYAHVINIVSIQRKFSPMHLFYFNKAGGPSLTPIMVATKEGWPMAPQVLLHLAKTWVNRVLFGIEPRYYGVAHFDDMAYLFRVPNMFDIPNDGGDLYKFSKDMVKLWVSFAKDENLEFRGLSFPLLEKTGPLRYFELNEVPKVIDDPIKHRMSFLQSLGFLKYVT